MKSPYWNMSVCLCMERLFNILKNYNCQWTISHSYLFIVCAHWTYNQSHHNFAYLQKLCPPYTKLQSFIVLLFLCWVYTHKIDGLVSYSKFEPTSLWTPIHKIGNPSLLYFYYFYSGVCTQNRWTCMLHKFWTHLLMDTPCFL